MSLERLIAEVFFWGLVGLSALVLSVRLLRWRLGRDDALLIAVALTVLAYFLAPSSLAGGAFVNTRLSLFPFFTLILWLGTFSFGAMARWLIQTGAALTALALLALHASAYVQLNEYLAEYLSVEGQLQPNTTLLPLTFTRSLRDSPLAGVKVGAFRHASGYLAACAGVVELENYEATTGYFPVHFKEELNPFVFLSPEGRGTDIGLQAEPPRVDIAAYEERTGKSIDYVLLWNVRPEQRDEPAGRAIFEQLEEGYDLVFTSSPRGLLHLYRRHPGGPFRRGRQRGSRRCAHDQGGRRVRQWHSRLLGTTKDSQAPSSCSESRLSSTLRAASGLTLLGACGIT
jgi:hypothetical protein